MRSSKLVAVKQLLSVSKFNAKLELNFIVFVSFQVRVPTHEDGRCIFWEFATDYYDIGFGLYFEWTKAQSNTVTVQISDSSEEDDESDENLNGKG